MCELTNKELSKVNELVNDYLGSCNSTIGDDQEWLEAEANREEAFHDQIFECEQCGWWSKVDDYASEKYQEEVGMTMVCSDCEG